MRVRIAKWQHRCPQVSCAAIVDDGDATAVRVAHDDGPDELVAVETGLVADGWIEITSGLDGGEKIRLPG